MTKGSSGRTYSSGLAVATLKDPPTAVRCVDEIDDVAFMGRNIRVSQDRFNMDEERT